MTKDEGRNQISTITSASQPSEVSETLSSWYVIALTSCLSRWRPGSRGSPRAVALRPSSRTCIEVVEDQVLRIEAIKQLPQPVEENQLAIGAAQFDVQGRERTNRGRSSRMASKRQAAASAKSALRSAARTRSRDRRCARRVRACRHPRPREMQPPGRAIRRRGSRRSGGAAGESGSGPRTHAHLV